MIQGVDVVFVHVKDPKGMAQWYQRVLGAEIGFRTHDLHWQEFVLPASRESARFGLDAIDDNASNIEMQKVVISFAVDNLEEFVKDLEEKGILFFGSPKIIDVGPALVATTQDPEDNWIQFSQRKQE